MTEQEIQEANKLIAEFMGLGVMEGFNEYTGKNYYYYNNSEMQDFEALPDYSYDWNALMPVLEKIERIGYSVTLCHFSCTISEINLDVSSYISEANFNSKLEAAYEAVVAFIKYPN